MANMNMRDFLTKLEETTDGEGTLLFEAGKEGEKIDPKIKEMMKKANVSYKWAYEPEGYDLVVLEHKEDGEAKDSWSVVFFEEAEAREGEEEKLFADLDITPEALNEQGTVVVPIQTVKGNFFDVVKLCIELASNKEYKGSMNAAKAKKAMSAAKAKK